MNKFLPILIQTKGKPIKSHQFFLVIWLTLIPKILIQGRENLKSFEIISLIHLDLNELPNISSFI